MDELIKAIAACSGIEEEFIKKSISSPKDVAHGDVAFPCFQVAKTSKTSPDDCAKKLQAEIKLPPGFSKAEAVGPYLNIFRDRPAFAEELLRNILQEKFEVGKPSPENVSQENILIEFQSCNIAKPFHVGHLRNTVIGQALDKIFRHQGYNVLSINHLGDWGTQFGFVWVGCEIWGRPETPDLEQIVDLYRQASALRKRQETNTLLAEDAGRPDANEAAREYFRKLEAGDSVAVEFWQWCYDISMEYFERMNRRLGVSFDLYRGESFYRDQLAATENILRAANILENSRGSLGVDLGKPLGFARIFTEDGRSLYITRDIAAAIHREENFHPSRIVYVVGAPQKLHFQQLKGIFEKLNSPISEKIIHVAYGHVPGVSTRKAVAVVGEEKEKEERIFLNDLIDDAHNRALEVYRNEVSKRPEGVDEDIVAESVALGALFFNYLCRSNIKDFHFNWDDALNFQGDTGPYVQYALARLYSIEEKAKAANINPQVHTSALNNLAELEVYSLIKLLSEFTATLEKITKDYEPYNLALYALSLAKSFSANYKKLRVIGEENRELAETRLALFMAIKYVLHTSLKLLGIPPLQKM